MDKRRPLENKLSPAAQKLVSHIHKNHKYISEKEIPQVLSGIKRFVNVVHKIYTEPQANVTLIEVRVGNKTVKKTKYSGDLEEFVKVLDKDKPHQGLSEAFEKYHKAISKDKYGR